MNMDVIPNPLRARAKAPRILIVDDASVLRLYYRQLLEREGYVVAEAINGVEALERAMQERFDLCIVDLNMPLMNGLDFLLALRRQKLTHSLPALVATTQTNPQDRAAALAAGANDYLTKPVPDDLLALHVAALLGRHLR